MIIDLFFVASEVCHSSALIGEVQEWILGSQGIGVFNRSSLARFWESRHMNCLAQLLSVVSGGCLGANVTISVNVVAGPIVVLVVFVATAVAIVVTDHKNQ